MMSTIELKNLLIQRIAEIEDISFLKAIKTILDAKAESRTLQLTPEITDMILESKKEIEKGLIIDNDLFERELEEWLNEK